MSDFSIIIYLSKEHRPGDRNGAEGRQLVAPGIQWAPPPNPQATVGPGSLKQQLFSFQRWAKDGTVLKNKTIK